MLRRPLLTAPPRLHSCPEDDSLDVDETLRANVENLMSNGLETFTVRWDFLFGEVVSPPPPPPVQLAAYEELVAEDPRGFEITRSRLEEIFPRLSDFATSSMGATVGRSIAPYKVPPEVLTKAYLASWGMKPDSIGARIIEARHTGRWRPACQQLHAMLDDPKLSGAGTLASAYEMAGGNPHFSDRSHASRFDRNLLLYAMIEAKMSITHRTLDDVEFGTLELFDQICGAGVGGYRVPVGYGDHDTYEFEPGFELDAFAPIVAYGSLETLRAWQLGSLRTGCSRAVGREEAAAFGAFAPEDVATHYFCEGLQGDRRPGFHLRRDAVARQRSAPFAMHRDRYCSAGHTISIEDALAYPGMFDEALYDTEIRDPSGIDGLVAPAEARGEEDITRASGYKTYSLRSWAYVTSSSDPATRPGMHRLRDLPVFRAKGCADLPGVGCGANPGSASASASPLRLNSDAAAYEAHAAATRDAAEFEVGRQMLRKVRCSTLIDARFPRDDGRRVCTEHPYGNASGCWAGSLELVEEPGLYSSRHWLDELEAPPPSPPPTSPSPPPPSPDPPSPPSPPPPPYYETQHELMARIRGVEERVCTSVYHLTVATRCEELGVALAESVVYRTTAPPSFPPVAPAPLPSPPGGGTGGAGHYAAGTGPPPSPPPPAPPPGRTAAPLKSARLSTLRLPTREPDRAPPERLRFGRDGYYATLAEEELAMARIAEGHSLDGLARCAATPDRSTSADAQTLPCATAAAEEECLSWLQSCGTLAQNTERPHLELALAGLPRTRGARLDGLELLLPEDPELASLLFRSAEGLPADAGYRVDVYASDGSSVPCAPQAAQANAAGLPEDRRVVHRCAAGSFDAASAYEHGAALYALEEAARVRLTLLGAYRQLWLREVVVVEVASASAVLPPLPPGVASAADAPRPPRPPPLPALPPVPPHPPPNVDNAQHAYENECAWYGEKLIPARTVVARSRNGAACGVDRYACCRIAVDHESVPSGFELTDSGCCWLIWHDSGAGPVPGQNAPVPRTDAVWFADDATIAQSVVRWRSFLTHHAGTGIVIVR